MKPIYFYSDDELHDLINSEALCALLAPLPPSLLREIVATHIQTHNQSEDDRQVLRSKEKEADNSICALLFGTMEMVDPVERSLGKSKEIVILTLYLLNIRNWAPPPLHFFTNHHIDLVNNSPHVIHTKRMHPYKLDNKSTEKVLLLDLSKMILFWGNVNIHTCLTPLRF